MSRKWEQHTDDSIIACLARIRDLEETVYKLQEMLRIAANYKNDDADARLNGVQAALGKAAEVKARRRGR